MQVVLRRLATVFACTVVLLVAPASCKEIKANVNCSILCRAHRSCFQNRLDELDCTDRCADQAEDDRLLRDDASDCARCVEGRSCSAIVDRCDWACAPVRQELDLASWR